MILVPQPIGEKSHFDPFSFVIAGLVPAIPIREAQPCLPKRDARDKPGHDELKAHVLMRHPD
jgi:hypothetical protein